MDDVERLRGSRNRSIGARMGMTAEIAAARLLNQRLAGSGWRSAAEVIAGLGAAQAQEFEAAKWALGLRIQGRTLDADVEQAFTEGHILRTHVMRPTWHFVTPADIRWLQELTGPRVHRRMSPYDRRLELDTAMKVRGAAIMERSLRDRRY